MNSTNVLDMVLDLIKNRFFSLGNEIDRNIIIFGVSMSSFPHIDNKKKDILILGNAPTQGKNIH